jgi:hypothetical protein
VVAIAAGDNHCLALKADGTVVAWGSDGEGSTSVPAGLTGVTAVAAGGNQSLALKSDGTVVAWGYEGEGLVTGAAGLSDVIAIDAGYYHCLALKSDRTMVAWGYDGDGQITIPAGLSDVFAIAAGKYHSLIFATKIYYVDALQADDSGAGTSWATAKKTIQAAVDLTLADDTVMVTNGFYPLSAEISVTTNITVKSVNGPDVTMVDGGGTVRGFNLGSSACLIAGFTITNGAAAQGGGVYCAVGSDAVVSNCLFNGNYADWHGGGMHCGTAINCEFNGNRADYYGGGAFKSRVNNSVFVGNNAAYYGGGLYIGSANNSGFGNNSAGYGGGLYESEANNCTIVSNSAVNHGGGMFRGSARNSIIWDNTAIGGGTNLSNTITHYCCSPDVVAGVKGCITNNPLFVGAATNDYRLADNSPCIDTGDNTYAPTNVTPFDLAGTNRIIGGTVDMGAFEWSGYRSAVDISAAVYLLLMGRVQ